MAPTHVASSPEQKRWLITFAEAIVHRLRAAGVTRSIQLVTPRLFAAKNNGWYVRLGSFRDREGGPYLFLDETLELESPRLWYGVWSPTLSGHRSVVRRATKLWPVIDNWAVNGRVTRSRLAHSFSEEPGSGEFYFGRYEWAQPNFSSPPPRGLLSRVVEFFVALDSLWSEQGREKESRRVPRTIAARRGQAKFRDDLLASFACTCCVTRCRTEAVLEAAHLESKRGSDIHEISNGLLLRSDIHTLFDLALFAIDPNNLSIALHPELDKHASEYRKYAGRRVRLPIGADGVIFRRRLRRRWTLFQRAAKRATP